MKRFILTTIPPVGETGGQAAPVGARSAGRWLALLEPVVPNESIFVTRFGSRADMESNGSTSMASVCAGTLALMDAGVPVKTPVAGISVGLVTEFGDDHQLNATSC
jgi:polyribonucleotide nucleotidyltransferase